MKWNLFRIFLSVLLILSLTVPILAEEPEAQWVVDEAGLLTAEERQSLGKNAADISKAYDVGVYIFTTEDHLDYGTTAFSAAEAIYEAFDLGIGEGKDGILLLLSMDTRYAQLLCHGEKADYAFNEYGLDALEAYYLDDFGSDNWNDGFSEYLQWCEKYLQAAADGQPYSEENPPMSAGEKAMAIAMTILMILGIPLIIAGIVILVLTAKMKSVAAATHASTYVSGNLNLTKHIDNFTHRTVTRRRKSNSNSGSNKSSRSGSYSGTGSHF